MIAAVVQQRPDKHATLAYKHEGRWRNYSNNKFINWVPTKFMDTDTMSWYTGATTSIPGSKWFVVETDEGNMVIATFNKDDWFSLHTGKRLQVNVTKWARIICSSL